KAIRKDRGEEVAASRGSPHPRRHPVVLLLQKSPTFDEEYGEEEAELSPRRSQAAARLIPPSSERWSKLTVTDLFRTVMGWKQPHIEPVARLIPLGSRRRSLKSIVTDLFRAVTGWKRYGPRSRVPLGSRWSTYRSVGKLNRNIGVAMELEDSLYPLLREVSIGTDPYEVFQDAEWALLIGAKPRGPGMERAGLLDINGQIYAKQVLHLFGYICT
ncbi:hypothetical protein BHM03_00056614, partial [Ensete ventricosum]